MTWHVNAELIVGVLLLVLGFALGLRAMRPSRPAPRYREAHRRLGPVPATVSAHQLGLAHRFAARVLGSRWRPRDEDFVAVAALWPTRPIPGPWGSRLVAMWSPELERFITPSAVFLELEELLERVELFSARIRSWRRRRVRS